MLHFKHQLFGGGVNAFASKLAPTSPPVSLARNPALIRPRSAFDLLLIFIRKRLKHRQSRLGCRPNADDAEWAERHGCRESAARTWMSVRRGPTELRRSEGTRRRRAKPGASTFGYLGMVRLSTFPSNSPKAKQSAPRRTLLIFTFPRLKNREISICYRASVPVTSLAPVGHFHPKTRHFIAPNQPASTLDLPDHKALPIMGALFASLIGLPALALA